MLTRVEIPGAAATGAGAAPWPVLVVVLGVMVVVLAGLVTALLLRRRTPRSTPAPGGPSPGARSDDDDLARFREFPPGSAAPAAPAGWAALAPAPAVDPVADQPSAGPRSRRDAVALLVSTPPP